MASDMKARSRIAVFCGYLVTATAQGDVPLNSQALCKVSSDDEPRMRSLADDYNAMVDLLERLDRVCRTRVTAYDGSTEQADVDALLARIRGAA